MPLTIEPLQETWIPSLSEFLISGLSTSGGHTHFAAPEVLRWKYLAPRPGANTPRSFVARKDEKIVGHVGLCTTAFRSTSEPNATVPALHMIDWLSGPEAQSAGAMLMLRAFRLAPVQYAFGCTAAAARVLLRAGFEHLFDVPVFHRVNSRLNSQVWLTLHGRSSLPKQVAWFGFDLAQSLRPANRRSGIEAQPIDHFGPEVERIFTGSSVQQVMMTSRAAELLNYYLQFPTKNFTGWLLRKDADVVGFALTSLIQKPGLKHGRIVECFLADARPALWNEVFSTLAVELEKAKADLVSCCASTPWVRAGLEQSGFFRRGRIPFYLRDPEKRIDRSKPFHLTHLEADLAYI